MERRAAGHGGAGRESRRAAALGLPSSEVALTVMRWLDALAERAERATELALGPPSREVALAVEALADRTGKAVADEAGRPRRRRPILLVHSRALAWMTVGDFGDSGGER